jgi:anti-anti-sigma factor
MASRDLAVTASYDAPSAAGFLRLSGEARIEVVDVLRTNAKAVFDQGARHLVLSVASLSFADSASIGTVLDLQKQAESRGGRLVLASPTPRFKRLIESMGLAARLPMAPDETAARALLR